MAAVPLAWGVQCVDRLSRRQKNIHNFEDKRTGIEVMVLKQKMKASGTVWKWVSSERQYADGLTKMSARQLWADRLRATTITLKHDPQFVAAKKKDAVSRRAEELVGSSKVYLITTVTIATQIIEVYAKPTRKPKEEDDTLKFTIMVMMTIFLLGFLFGCWFARRCCRTKTTPSPPTRFPQSIWTTTTGSQYHVDTACGGLGSARTATQKFACCTCITTVDGDGTRRRAR